MVIISQHYAPSFKKIAKAKPKHLKTLKNYSFLTGKGRKGKI